MSLQSGTLRRVRVVMLAAVVCVASVLAALLAASWAGGGGSATSIGEPVHTARPAVFERAIAARMRAQRLDYRWVACVRTSHRFEGVGVVRCNVDFGIDPHVEAYCSVLRGGRLVTSATNPAIPCAPDDAGYTATIVRYG
jgi:hypothetical protein